METRDDRLYSKDHEWVLSEDGQVLIGITDYAQHALGDVVFVELPEVGAELSAGDVLGVVESVKAASEVYTPISGRVIAVNEDLEASPEALNEQPFEQWLARLEPSRPEEMQTLMDEADYQVLCAKEDDDG
ncbi:MAG: glycine cleavage system protein GcvH [Ruminococcaceae bacterium]|jgi:glycine cleavage system H protein|nr:glycine cleavage system protein GcvH [Oscillospiraceae bacterium]